MAVDLVDVPHGPAKDASPEASPPPPGRDVKHLTTTQFASMPLCAATQRALREAMGHTYATEVQHNCIPAALAGHDVVGQAKTGTGKTLAFLIPVIEALAAGPSDGRAGFRCIVLTPTRELAMQILTEWKKLTTFHRLTGLMMVGGTNKASDVRALHRPPDLLVATPGRLLDHLNTTPGMAATVATVRFLVLDEMDRLLDEGFWRDVERITRFLPPREARQTLLFSATMSDSVLKTATQLTRPGGTKTLRMTSESESNVHQHVRQEVIVTPLLSQVEVLLALLSTEMAKPGYKVLVFFTTARLTQCMAELFNLMGVPVLEIHSRKSQGHRSAVSEKFRVGRDLILFSSDVSARGMDYPDVSCVVQVGMAASQEQYIHRLGRTARGTAEAGHAVLLLADFERPFIRDLVTLGVAEVPAPPISPQVTALAARGRDALARSKGEADRAAQVYVAWLGFYLSMTRKHGQSAEALVKMANEYVPWLFRLPGPPAIQMSTAGKMNLKGVPGVMTQSRQATAARWQPRRGPR
eukprot:EG_transcript_6122